MTRHMQHSKSLQKITGIELHPSFVLVLLAKAPTLEGLCMFRGVECVSTGYTRFGLPSTNYHYN